MTDFPSYPGSETAPKWLEEAFYETSVPKKNIALRKAYDEIVRLRNDAQGSREAVIAECAAVARAMTIKLLNELATPPNIRGLNYYDNTHLEYGHKISDLIEANIRDLALPSPESK